MDLTHEDVLLSHFEAGERMSRGDHDTKTIIQGFSFVAYVMGVLDGSSFTSSFCPPAVAERSSIMGKIGARLRARSILSVENKLPAFGVVLLVASEEWPCHAKAPP
jgi:hypothetical protein